jgi:hypothetical protein
MHLLDSGSFLFRTPHKDALILGIKTVMNIRGVGGDVAKIKSPLVYTFLDSKGEYVGFHYQSLYLLESLPIPLFATGPAEQQLWSFLLGPSSPCAITSKGRFIPIFRCVTPGFHWMPERLKTFPTLESRRRTAQRVHDMPDHGGLDLAWSPVVESVEGAEHEKQVCRYRYASGCEESRKAHARNAGAPRMENYQAGAGASARV